MATNYKVVVDEIDVDIDELFPSITTEVTTGNGLTGGGDLAASREISHGDTSSQDTVTNEGSAVIQSIELDEFGHITNLTTNDILNKMGGYTEDIAVAMNDIDASTHNFATITDGTTAVTFINVPDGAYTVTLLVESDTINLTGLTIKWQGGDAPEVTTESDLIFLTTLDNGSVWLGTASLEYV